MNLYSKLADDVIKDSYFRELLEKLIFLNSKYIFEEILSIDVYLESKEILDLCKFADILSNWEDGIHKNTANIVISMLLNSNLNDTRLSFYVKSVLWKSWNFQWMLTAKINENEIELPINNELEILFKKQIQAIPYAEGLTFTDDQFLIYEWLKHNSWFSFSWPTSMGKSFVIKHYINSLVINNDWNIVVLVPSRALITQFTNDIKKELYQVLDNQNYQVLNNPDGLNLQNIHNKYIAVFTPERFIAFISANPSFIVSHLFVDEAQKMWNLDKRWMLLFLSINLALKKFSNLKIYFSSPNIKNPWKFLESFWKDWENSHIVKSWLVSQNIFHVQFSKRKIIKIWELFSSIFEFKPKYSPENIYSFICDIWINSIWWNIIYANSSSKSIESCLDLISELKKKWYKHQCSKKLLDTITQIKQTIHNEYYLPEFLEYWVAYHFWNLPQFIRIIIEELFISGDIKYLVCTSTLLEWVNLPAKNLYITSEIYFKKKVFESIEFFNLIGRAWRLKYDLYWNIFCLDSAWNSWNKLNKILYQAWWDIEIWAKKIFAKYYKDIGAYIKNEKIQKLNDTKPKKQLFWFIENVLVIEARWLVNKNYFNSLFSDTENFDLVDIINENAYSISIPDYIVTSYPDIDIKLQNRIYCNLKLKFNNGERLSMLDTNNLTDFFDLYEWSKLEEWISREALIVYKIILENWINGYPLGRIISSTLKYYTEKEKLIRLFNQWDLIKFDRNNKKHVNYIINKVIDDIEKIVKFVFEKYFRHYRALLVEITKDNSYDDISQYIQFGSRNLLIIALQKLWISRQAAFYIDEKYKTCFSINSNWNIQCDDIMLIALIEHDNIHSKEIILNFLPDLLDSFSF